MAEQMNLFDVKESYNLNTLRRMCRDYIKAKYPSPVEDESYTDYLSFINDESDLLFMEKIREIANQIEQRIYGKQKETIQDVYRYDRNQGKLLKKS